MKIRFWIIMFITVMVVGGMAIGVTSTQVEAKGKKRSKVTFHLNKKGTLVVKGKGKMPQNKKYSGSKKVKKVVIKKGVKSVSNYAFCDCEKLKSVKMPKTIKRIGDGAFKNTRIKKITIPKKIKIICGEAFYGCKKLKKVTMPGSFKVDGLADEGGDGIFDRYSVKTIKLSTGLKVSCACYMKAANIIVSKKDKKYKSIKGVVYSKNGQDLVRVPYCKKKVKIKEGCKNVYTAAFLYGQHVWDDDDMCYSCAEEIEIPQSVTKISSSKYGYGGIVENPCLKKVTVKTQTLDETSVWHLLKDFSNFGVYELETTLSLSVTPESIMSQLKNYKCVNKMYVSSQNTLIAYTGNDKVANIPDGVVKIGQEAMAKGYFEKTPGGDKVEKIVMPDSVKIIENHAFANRKSLKELVWSKSLEEIGTDLISESAITDLTLPTSVTKMAENAFSFSKIKKLTIPEGYVSLPNYCFWACKDLRTINFPSTLREIHSSTFGAIDGLDINTLIKGKNIKIID